MDEGHFFKFDPTITFSYEAFERERGKIKKQDELGLESTGSLFVNQFMVFQLSSDKEGDTIIESSSVTPSLSGGKEKPDIQMNIEMLSFHLGENEAIQSDTKATMRIVIGKDPNSKDKYFDTAFWTISAGLDLYNQYKNRKTHGPENKADFSKAFGNRPIEIPGGLANLTFDVLKHKEPKWWQRIFKFLESNVGQSLTKVVGFPAITIPAVRVLEELLNRLELDKPDILFRSRPHVLALTKQAKKDYISGSQRVLVGAMNPGFCVFARGRDFEKIANAEAFYYPTYGKLIPKNVTNEQLFSQEYHDPFKDITYAVFRIGMKETKLDPTFNYGT